MHIIFHYENAKTDWHQEKKILKLVHLLVTISNSKVAMLKTI